MIKIRNPRDLTITDLENCMDKNYLQKLDEVKVADRFIRYLNMNDDTDYFLPEEQPSVNDSIDVIATSKSNLNNKFKMQITTADCEMRESTGRQNKINCPQCGYGIKISNFERITNKSDFEKIFEWLYKSIEAKSKKYSSESKKEMILLLDGWWEIGKLSDDLIKNFKNIYKDFLKNSKFKEIWIVYIKESKQLF